MGTLNVLEATRELDNLKAALIITTDKVYKNRNLFRGYLETDELGGDDPYGSSKAAADIASQSWIKSFAKVPIAIARAGNVIGGGDWAQDRIIPDLVNAYTKKELPTLRFPHAIRPWQHVLDCLNGYLQLLDKQTSQDATGEWNFGPNLTEQHSVLNLVESFASTWGVEGDYWIMDSNVSHHETGFLLLDSTKAREQLGWSDKLNFDDAVAWTSSWYRSEKSALSRTREQIKNFYKLL
jgi:CDP-glucose 4,6-dehydratase